MDEDLMAQMPGDGMADCAGGAGRESARGRIARLAEQCRRRLAGLEALLKVAERAENGSPLEETLWELSCRLEGRGSVNGY